MPSLGWTAWFAKMSVVNLQSCAVEGALRWPSRCRLQHASPLRHGSCFCNRRRLLSALEVASHAQVCPKFGQKPGYSVSPGGPAKPNLRFKSAVLNVPEISEGLSCEHVREVDLLAMEADPAAGRHGHGSVMESPGLLLSVLMVFARRAPVCCGPWSQRAGGGGFQYLASGLLSLIRPTSNPSEPRVPNQDPPKEEEPNCQGKGPDANGDRVQICRRWDHERDQSDRQNRRHPKPEEP